MKGPIGIFDSGYGGLTVMKSIVQYLPDYDYIYIGDNARTPYGNRSFETVYHYTWEAVKWLFQKGCPLVILACNTASAKALRTIQQQNLPVDFPTNRVLGVIRPTAEVMDQFTHNRKIGILATRGTVQSESYILEIKKLFPSIEIFQQACPLLVPLIENNELDNHGTDFFIKKYIHDLLQQDPGIDTILLACTHYPVLLKKITEYTPIDIQIVSQGEIVAESLTAYLKRHPEMEGRISRNSTHEFYTTDSTADFNEHAPAFFGSPVLSQHVII
ncbi:MAG: glutamate racemase [Bacteroidetes bacterium]|nr:glutamate racemase [Bacteroidota bacterium]